MKNVQLNIWRNLNFQQVILSSHGYVTTSLPCYVQCPIRGDAEAGRFLSANEDEITFLTFF